MSDEARETTEPTADGTPTPARPRRYFTARTGMGIAAGTAIAILVAAILLVVMYRTGTFNTYIKARFVQRMADMGITFDADAFTVTASPLTLHLRNATFNDTTTGDRLFFIREADLTMSVRDMYALELSRDISIDTTDINGAEVWVKFDKDGRSNFSNLKVVEDQKGSAVNFRYESIKFSLANSVFHFGDLSRSISANANDVVFKFEPQDYTAPDDQKRYKFDLTANNSDFAYEDKKVEKISAHAMGVADRMGADITSLDVNSPIGDSTLSGRLTDWASPKYDLDIQTSLDITQAAGIFQSETPLTGVGNFKGHLTGNGENYHIEGTADSEGLRAGAVYLKGLDVTATVSGTNSNYAASGNAIAQMLTFDDFKIDFLKLSGNVRGTGTDFRWVGELQAAAAKTGKLGLGGLFLSDAMADYKDKQLAMSAGNGRTHTFDIGDTRFTDLTARDLKFTGNGDNFTITSPSAQSRSFTTPDYSLDGVTGSDVRVGRRPGETKVDITGLHSETAQIKGNRLKNVTTDKFNFTDLPNSTNVTATNLHADRLEASGAVVSGLEAPAVDLNDQAGGAMIVHADKLRVAKIDTNSAIIGSLNIGGVRLTIRRGTLEARSNDIDAGDIELKKTASMPSGGELQNAKIAHPVYILEPSGRYRATADMSIGGGTLGSVALGNATAKVDVNNDRAALNEITAQVMNGQFNGNAAIALSNRGSSNVVGDFSNLDVGKLLTLTGGRVLPIDGQTTGHVDLTFAGTSFRNASGTLDADVVANAGAADRGQIPITGKIKISGANGLFNVDLADLNSANSKLSAAGHFDLKDDGSNLTVALRSTDASEIDRLIRVLGISDTLEEQLNSLEVQFAGNLNFDGTITGNLSDPTIEGKAALDSLAMRGRPLGAVTTDIFVSPLGTDLKNGKLTQADGGSATFAVSMPRGGANNTSVAATLTNVNAGNLLAALPITLPDRIRDLDGQTSGKVDISGLPNNAQGQMDLAAAKGTIAGQAFDNLTVRAVFSGTLITLEKTEMKLGSGSFTASGTYDRASSQFNFDLGGKAVPAPLLVALIPNSDSIPPIKGDVDFMAKATGYSDRPATYNFNFEGASPNVLVNESSLGEVHFKGVTEGQVLKADLTAGLQGRPQTISATLNFADEDLPFTAVTEFDQSPLEPFLSFIPQLKNIPITGMGTGRIDFGGNISSIDPVTGQRVYAGSGLSGTARFSQLAMQIQDTPLSAAEPISIRFNTREVIFESAKFAGGGSNMTISGTKALVADAVNDLKIDGRVNLALLNLTTKDTFFAGFADAAISLTGPNSDARLSGTANVINGSVATFLGSDRFTFDRVKANVIFTSNQVEVEEANGYLGGGRFTGSGGGTLDGLSLTAFRFSLAGNDVTVPLPKDFITTGDAQLEVSGIRRQPTNELQVAVTGRVFARRSLYSKDIDLANLLSSRRDAVLTSGGGGGVSTQFDLVIEGRDALVVKNNVADLTASVSLQLTGDADNPRLAGRITANSGTIFFRKDRYVVQRGVLEFPPETFIDPVIDLQAESEIAGYQIFVNLSGPLKDSEQLNATLRSSPALPQADVVSLVTTGNLSNTSGGIPTLAQGGINTAAEVLTDAIINNPVRKATDKLFGLNVFEIDPIISGSQVNASARLTVGRQINNNLRVTYSTNLSQDQNQVLALEYRVSNKLSFVAQYEQRSLSNVTKNRDNFSFEVRFRKRF
ncbi:MAG: translocation/assembly module TamB domain-containing protein [Acidobacteria bacterium]|nr:translocation/assembly module TamB domain-containing protein [Acidobacteriota bacterium]